jgi:cell division protein FtsL
MTKYKKRVKVNRAKRTKEFDLKVFLASFKGNKKVVSVGVVCLVFMAFLTYLVQINTMATKGFEIRELEDQIAVLQDDNKRLELQVIELQSMSTLKEKMRGMNLVEADEVAYLNTMGTAFAQK